MPAKVKSIENPYAYRSQKVAGTTDCVSLASNVTFKSIQRVFLIFAFMIATMLIFRNYSDRVQNTQIKEDHIYLRRNDMNIPKKVTTAPHKKDDGKISYNKKAIPPKISQDHQHSLLRSNTNKPIANSTRTNLYDTDETLKPIKLNLRSRKKSPSPTMTPITHNYKLSNHSTANHTSSPLSTSTDNSTVKVTPTPTVAIIATFSSSSYINSSATPSINSSHVPLINNITSTSVVGTPSPATAITAPIPSTSTATNTDITAKNKYTKSRISTSPPTKLISQKSSSTSSPLSASSQAQTSVIWLRPSYGFEAKFDRKQQRRNIKGGGSNTDPLLSRYCWQSVGKMDDESRVMLLSRLFGYHNNTTIISPSPSTSTMISSFRNHSFKHLQFCNSHQYQPQAQLQAKERGITKNKIIKTEQLSFEPPVQSTFYSRSSDITNTTKSNNNKPRIQLSYPYDFSTAPEYELSTNNVFSTQPLDTLYYFLISVPTGVNSDKDIPISQHSQCFFGSDRFGHFCIQTSLGSSSKNKQKVRVTAGFQSYDITSDNNKNNDGSFIAKPVSIGMNDKFLHEVDIQQSPSSVPSVNTTVLLVYRCRRITNKNKSSIRSSQLSKDDLQYELQVSINGMSFESIATATLFPIPHPTDKYTATHALSLSLHGSNNTLSMINSSVSSLTHLQLPPPPPTEYQWRWTFNSDTSAISNSFTADKDISSSDSVSSLWRFGCAYNTCKPPWSIAEILILEKSMSSPSSSLITISGDNQLLDQEVAGVFKHFQNKYNLLLGRQINGVDSASASATVMIENHNIPPVLIDSKSSLHTSTSNTNNVAINNNTASTSPRLRQTKIVPVTPTVVYSDCKPFTSHQIDQYTPPTAASAASRLEWSKAVESVMTEIRQHSQGGETLREFVKTKASELQVIRDKLFC